MAADRTTPPRAWGPRPLPRPARAETPLGAALMSLGDRDRRVVLWHLCWAPRTFFELLRCRPRVGRRALRRELGALERLGLVRYRTRNGGAGGAVFALTPHGETLRPILGAMYLWGLEARRWTGPVPEPEESG